MTPTLSFSLDPRTHFPLIEVPGQDFALFWMPVTKVQIEYFLSETIDGQFDRVWYHERLRNNPRTIPEKLTAQNLLHAFLTHITLYEARMFCRWYGKDFDLPTAEEWHRTLHAFDQFAADPAFVQQVLALPGIHPRARLLIQSCENALPGYQRLRDASERRLSHQLLLRSGMLEYVYQDPLHNLYGACGSQFQARNYSNAGQGTFLPLRHPDVGDRMSNLGLRPILRKRL
jgi:Sulfatase-modifying factor enzyme 1